VDFLFTCNRHLSAKSPRRRQHSRCRMTDFNPVTHARSRDPVTSHMTAARLDEFAGTHAEKILACLTKYGPQTVDELAVRLDMQTQAVNKRLPDLQRRGKAIPTGDARHSRSGRLERVWGAA